MADAEEIARRDAERAATLQRQAVRAQRRQKEDEKDLRTILKETGNLTICVGSGVTIFSAKDTEKARLSWKGLIQSGFDYLQDELPNFCKTNEDVIQSSISMLENRSARTGHVLAVAKDLTDLLAEQGKFAEWLRSQFKNLYDDAPHRDILDSLKKLHKSGVALMTTNYDDLIERHCGLEPIDGSNENRVSDFNRREAPRGVFHPHGYWDNPKTVVLNAEQYYGVRDKDSVQAALRNIFVGRHVLFVGCGSGVADPNFGPLLKWLGKIEMNKSHSHYILLERDENPSELENLPLRKVRVAEHAEIGPWLLSLLDENSLAEGTIHDFPKDSERRKIHSWLAPLEQSAFLREACNIHEPGTREWTLMRDRIVDKWRAHSPSFVLLSGEAGCGKTILCSSIISHTQKACRGPGFRRSRDSLAYFFCSTFDVFDPCPTVRQHDFDAYLRTTIAHLCPPKHMFPVLRNLYHECTKHHPARNPTNRELQDILVGIVEQLCNTGSDRTGSYQQNRPKSPIELGETFMVIDGLDGISANRRDGYLSFIKKIADLNIPHLHALVTVRAKGSIERSLRKYGEWVPLLLNREMMEDAMRSYVANVLEVDWQLQELPTHTKRVVMARLVDQKRGSFKWVSEKIQELKQLETVDSRRIDEILPPVDDPRNEILDEPERDSSGTEMDSGSVLYFDDILETDRNLHYEVDSAVTWLKRYEDLLEEWIDSIEDEALEFLDKPVPPTRIALLDVGYDMEDPFIRGAQDIGRLTIRNFTGNGPLNDMHDATGRGTHALTLLLKLAPNSRIVVARISDGRVVDSTSEVEQRVAKAIMWAMKCRVDILILPFGLYSSHPFWAVEEAVFHAHASGVVVVAAASSRHSNKDSNFLARLQEVLVVDAMDHSGHSLPSKGGRRRFLTLGKCVPSSWLNKVDAWKHVRSGTAVAAVIAGAVAATVRDWSNHILYDGPYTTVMHPLEAMRVLQYLVPTDGESVPHPWARFQNIHEAKSQLFDILQSLRHE